MLLPGQDPHHTPPPAVHGPVRPERVLEGAAIHPVAEVLAQAVMLPGLPGDGEWGRGETQSEAASVPVQRRTGGSVGSKPEMRWGQGLARKRGESELLTVQEPPRRIKKGSEWPLETVSYVAPCSPNGVTEYFAQVHPEVSAEAWSPEFSPTLFPYITLLLPQ